MNPTNSTVYSNSFLPPPLSDTAKAVNEIRLEIEASQWLSGDDIAASQITKLNATVDHFIEHSTWFRNRLERTGTAMRSFVSMSDIHRLPLLDKGSLQRDESNIFNIHVPSEHGELTSFETSGSTGRPTKVMRTTLNEIDLFAVTLREHDWHRRSFASRMCGIRTHSEGPILMPSWGTPVSLFFESGQSLLLPLSWKVDALADAIRDFSPAYLHGFPSIMLAVKRRIEQSGHCLPHLREIIVYGESLSDEVRGEISSFFSVPVTCLYCSQELGAIACQCPISMNFHVTSDFLLVEVLDDLGHPCLPGTIGKVVVTDLRNYATPLIRYDIGDFAELADGCICGRKGVTLRSIKGRLRNLLVLPDGNRCWPRLGYFFRRFASRKPIHQFQLVQRTRSAIDAYLVVDEPLSEALELAFTETFASMVGYRFSFGFHYFHDALPTRAGSKFEDFRCEIAE